MRSFFEILHVDPGFDSTNVLTAGLPIPEKRFPNPVQLNAYLRQIVENVQALPGVRDVALTSALPLRWLGLRHALPDRRTVPFVDRANRPAGFFKMVSPSYFRSIGMTSAQGPRSSTKVTSKGAAPVTVINETMVRKYFAGQEPLGQRILVQEIVPGKAQLGPEIPWEVVGVVADEKVNGMSDKSDNPGLYVTNEQSPVFFQNLVVRGNMNPSLLTAALRQAVRKVDKDQPLTDVKTLDQRKAESMASDRLESFLLGAFAAIAMLLSAVGIYGVTAYSVAQRTHELGIRAALGASASRLLRLVLQGGMVLTGIGLVVGILGAFGLTRLMASLLFGVSARDPFTIAAVGAVLACVSLLACYIPAWRATKVDPAVALRYE